MHRAQPVAAGALDVKLLEQPDPEPDQHRVGGTDLYRATNRRRRDRAKTGKNRNCDKNICQSTVGTVRQDFDWHLSRLSTAGSATRFAHYLLLDALTSAIGTTRTSRDVRYSVGIGGKADVC